MTSIADLNQRINDLNKSLNDLRAESVETLLDLMLPFTSIMTVIGYTPGFNDGEPCVHTTDVCINVHQHILHDQTEFLGALPTLIKGPIWKKDPDLLAENTALCHQHGHAYNPPPDHVFDAVRNILVPMLDQQYETNYFVTYVRRHNPQIPVLFEFKKHVGDYDCGY